MTNLIRAEEATPGMQIIESDGALMDIVAIEKLGRRTRISCRSFGPSPAPTYVVASAAIIRVFQREAE